MSRKDHTYGKITFVGMSRAFADALMAKAAERVTEEVTAGDSHCPFCGAKPKAPCCTKGGRSLNDYHKARKG